MPTAQEKLAVLEAREPGLRTALAVHLQSLSDMAARVAHKIASREYADGVCGFNHYWDAMKEAEGNLCDILDEIRFAKWAVEDARDDENHPNTDEHRAACVSCIMAHDKALPDPQE